MDAVDKKMIRRGLILQGLRLELRGLSDAALIAFLAGQGDVITKLDVRAELDYLSGRGKEYVEITERADRLWKAKLSPRGADLLDERIADDPGVLLGR